MEERCLCESSEVLVFACSGASNVGQITNQAAMELDKRGAGRMFCLAGLGGHVAGMIESTKAGRVIVALDGCPVACARNTLEHLHFKIDVYLDITELGIEKVHKFEMAAEDVSRVVNEVSQKLKPLGMIKQKVNKESKTNSLQEPGHVRNHEKIHNLRSAGDYGVREDHY